MRRPPYFATRGHLLVCTGPRCRERASGLFGALWRRLEAEQLAYYAGGTVRLTESGCQGACDFGPSAIAYRSGEEAWYFAQDEVSLVAIARALHGREALPADRRYDEPAAGS